MNGVSTASRRDTTDAGSFATTTAATSITAYRTEGPEGGRGGGHDGEHEDEQGDDLHLRRDPVDPAVHRYE